MEFKHQSVLLSECMESLNIRPDGIYVDGTLAAAVIHTRSAAGFRTKAGSSGSTRTKLP